MPMRLTPLVNNEIYHVINRGNGASDIYNNYNDYLTFLETITYYQNKDVNPKFSHFRKFPFEDQKEILYNLKENKDYYVDIIAYCLMPNHFHLLLKQLRENGIKNFIRLSCDSYSKYFNLKNKRKGSIYEGRFKAILIENNNQFLHVSRYIHLNPYTSSLVRNIEQLENYQFSSLPEYLKKNNNDICNKNLILDQFGSIEEYKKFVFDQADYQRNLDLIKHHLIDENY